MSLIYNLSQSVVGDGCKIMETSSYCHCRSMDVGGYRKVPGIGHVGDLSFLTKGDLEKVGVRGKHADRVLNSIASGKQRPLKSLIFALGIPEVGLETARTLANHFSSLDALAKTEPSDLEGISGMGPKVPQAIITFFEPLANRAILVKLKRTGVRI